MPAAASERIQNGHLLFLHITADPPHLQECLSWMFHFPVMGMDLLSSMANE